MFLVRGCTTSGNSQLDISYLFAYNEQVNNDRLDVLRMDSLCTGDSIDPAGQYGCHDTHPCCLGDPRPVPVGR